MGSFRERASPKSDFYFYFRSEDLQSNRQRLKITAYFIGYNIQDTVAFTIRHYQKFCSKIVYYDNHSTDLSRDIALQMGCDVRLFGRPGVLDDQAYLDIKNHCWKTDDSDLVIVCDDDEIVLCPPSDPVATIYKTQGYGMFSDTMPEKEWTEVLTGVPDNQYSKLAIFNPKKIREIGYVYGCHGHQTKPHGTLFYGSQVIPLLHYRTVGGVDRLINRYRLYNEKKRGEANIRYNLAHHYQQEEKDLRLWFDVELKRSETLSFPGFIF